MKQGKISEELKSLMIVAVVFTLISVGQNARIEDQNVKIDNLITSTNTKIDELTSQMKSEREVIQSLMEVEWAQADYLETKLENIDLTNTAQDLNIAENAYDIERAVRASNSNFIFLKEHLNELKKNNSLIMTEYDMIPSTDFEL